MNLERRTCLPRHIGIIMDGNGRWAELRGEPREAGHRAGSHSARRVITSCRRLGIEALTLYAFSSQNWARPRSEVDGLMVLLGDFLSSEQDEILNNDIRLNAIGDLHKLPASVREALCALRGASVSNTKMTLTLALSYGGQEEIAAVARELAAEAAAGRLDPASIDAKTFGARIPSLDVGNPDLIIRTGGEIRLSNFLLYGAAYAELAFVDCLWPDFSEEDLLDALENFQNRERRFGLVGQRTPRANSPVAA